MKPDYKSMSLDQLNAEKEKLFKRNPELRQFQKEIDELLDKSGDQESRAKVAKFLMESSIIKLNKVIKDLRKEGN